MEMNDILNRLRITSLTPMQEEAYDTILHSKRDLVLLSPTGTGKTLAYLLPLVELIETASDAVQALVIVPGRELALQSDEVLRSMKAGVRSVSCYGGRAAMDEHRTLRQVRPQIVFGTPGRLNDHLDKGNISPYHIRYLIIDEYDKCLEMGFRDEMIRLVRKLPGLRRRILLSATEGAIEQGALRIDDSWARIDYLDTTFQAGNDTNATVNEKVTLHEVRSERKDKLETLGGLLRSLGDTQSIVFLSYRDSVERTDHYLRQEGFVTSAFHGGLEQRQREDALYKFSNGSANILVATDLASRGLDIPDIQNIIHYHLPLSPEEYIHRVGRTARWDKHGKTYFIVGPEEQIPEFVEGEIEPYDLPQALSPLPVPKMATIYIGKGKKDKLSKGDVVGFLCKKGGLTTSEIGRIDVKDRYSYAAIHRGKVNQVLHQTAGEKIKGIKTIVEEVR